MKIINLVTMNIFDIPPKDAKALLESSPDIFAKVSRNNKVSKKSVKSAGEDTVLNKILDE